MLIFPRLQRNFTAEFPRLSAKVLFRGLGKDFSPLKWNFAISLELEDTVGEFFGRVASDAPATLLLPSSRNIAPAMRVVAGFAATA